MLEPLPLRAQGRGFGRGSGGGGCLASRGNQNLLAWIAERKESWSEGWADEGVGRGGLHLM